MKENNLGFFSALAVAAGVSIWASFSLKSEDSQINAFPDSKLRNLVEIVEKSESEVPQSRNYFVSDTDNSTNYRTNNFKNDDPEVLLARMIFGEARSCSDIERIAVGYTAVNRAKDNKKWNGTTLEEAILKPWQYSCFNENDPNLELIKNPEMKDFESFLECLDIAKGIIEGKYQDPTGGATHYHLDSIKPKWIKGASKIGRVKTHEGYGDHIFYKEN